MIRTKGKTPSADHRGLAVIHRKPEAALTKAELIETISAMKHAMVQMAEAMRSVEANARETRDMVYQLHGWQKVQPNAGGFNRVLEQERIKTEARRKQQ